MRNVIYGINLTLDGCCDHTKLNGDDEVHEYYTDLMQDVDLLVFGRKTYQLMVPFWPEVAKSQNMDKASNEFARAFDSLTKIVFSRSLETAESKNTRIVRTNPRDELLRLKQEPGKGILLGGVDIPSQLIELGLFGINVCLLFGPEGVPKLTGRHPVCGASLSLSERRTSFKKGCKGHVSLLELRHVLRLHVDGGERQPKLGRELDAGIVQVERHGFRGLAVEGFQ